MAGTEISDTLEDYLEAIYTLVSRNKVARSMEIAELLGVKRPTVTTALQSLAEKGLINYEPRSYITLTKQGNNIAQCIDRRHHVLRDVFTNVLGLGAEEAEESACKMEHGMTMNVCRQMTGLLTAVQRDGNIAKKLSTGIKRESRHINCHQPSCYGVASSSVKPDKKAPDEIYDLNSLKAGQSGIIFRILGRGKMKKRMTEMGITSGQEIRIIKAAPLGDPLLVKIRNFNLSLRREDAANILVDTR